MAEINKYSCTGCRNQCKVEILGDDTPTRCVTRGGFSMIDPHWVRTKTKGK